MHAYVNTAVLIFALGLAPAAPAAGKGSASSAAASSTVAAKAAGAGRAVAGGSSVAAGGGSARTTGGGMYGSHRAAPELDPTRRISEQDCTKPIAFDAGNLRCK
jgi:hypothetical protein